MPEILSSYSLVSFHSPTVSYNSWQLPVSKGGRASDGPWSFISFPGNVHPLLTIFSLVNKWFMDKQHHLLEHVKMQNLRPHPHLLKITLHFSTILGNLCARACLRSTTAYHVLSSIASLWATPNLCFLGQGEWVMDVSPHLVAILTRNSKSMSNCSKLIQVSRVRKITSVGCRKKIIAVIREALLVISEESQGTRETPFFSKKTKR